MSAEGLISTALAQDIQSHRGTGLWLLDEHEQPVPSYQPSGLILVTNRYDVYQRFAAAGWTIEYSDWVFNTEHQPQSQYDVIYYRVSKEKAIVNHVISAAENLLTPSGKLKLYGAKTEGLKGYYDRLRKSGVRAQLDKLGKGAMVASVEAFPVEAKRSEAGQYHEMVPIANLEGCPIYSKPGVFGWQKIDAGSEFLANSWYMVANTEDSASVLDLGCGYGYLSLRLWHSLTPQQQLSTSIIGTDSNAGAIICCEKNFAEHGVNGEVVAADCGDSVTKQFDLVICNPPFHQGFGIEGELTDRFLASAQQHLALTGQALFVVNGFVPLAKKAERYFHEIDVFADNGSFKLIRLAKPIF